MLHHHHETPAAPTRVVLLGGSGFLGRYLIPHLESLGIEVISTSSKDIDLCVPEAVEKLQATIKADDTIIFASALTPDRGRDRNTMLKNVAMADHVCQFLENGGCAHLIYISSDAVYRDGEHLISESSCCNPSSLYGLGHITREGLLQETAQRLSLPLAILRPPALYGDGDPHNSYGPNRFRRMAAEKGKITMFGGGEEKRDHVYVEDAVHLIGLCVTHKSEGILNLATGTSVPFMDVAQKVAELSDGDVEIECLPRNNPITHIHFDVTALLKSFPSFSFTPLLDEGLTRAFGNQDD